MEFFIDEKQMKNVPFVYQHSHVHYKSQLINLTNGVQQTPRLMKS